MKVAFITEMGFEGKIPSTHTNMRTEFAWMNALNADHFCIHNLSHVKDYEHVSLEYKKRVIHEEINLIAYLQIRSQN